MNDLNDVLPVSAADDVGAPFGVRLFHPADRHALLRFYEDFQPKRAAQGLPPAGARGIARWLDAVLPSGVHLLVERDGRFIGHALLAPMAIHSAEYAIWLHQDVRGRGIGTAVNRVAVRAARAAGFRRIWLSVESDNRAALRSYRRAGFRLRAGTLLSLEAQMEMEL